MVVTLDGPGGVGKSSVSKRLAGQLGFTVLDTGALYRAVALAANLADMTGETNEDALEAWLSRLQVTVELDGGRFVVLLDGGDVEPFIRNEEIGQTASLLSALAPVRGYLLDVQRRAADAGDLVAEGRDMGTVVFPHAQVKFFITATDQERARRRWLELKGSQPGLTMEAVRRELAQRDERDSQRALSPLKPAGDAHIIDTTELSLAQVVSALAEMVRDSCSTL